MSNAYYEMASDWWANPVNFGAGGLGVGYGSCDVEFWSPTARCFCLVSLSGFASGILFGTVELQSGWKQLACRSSFAMAHLHGHRGDARVDGVFNRNQPRVLIKAIGRYQLFDWHIFYSRRWDVLGNTSGYLSGSWSFKQMYRFDNN